MVVVCAVVVTFVITVSMRFLITSVRVSVMVITVHVFSQVEVLFTAMEDLDLNHVEE